MAKTTAQTTSTNDISLVDRFILRTSAAAGFTVNNVEAAVAIAPIGYQSARAKHDINARIAAAKKYAAAL